MFVFSGYITDFFKQSREEPAGLHIDGQYQTNLFLLARMTMTHELGHSLSFLGGADLIQIGHESGPGVLWSLPTCEDEDQRYMRRTFFWGDHIFAIRVKPIIP